MPHPVQTRRPAFLIWALPLAALGQVFLAQAGHPWTLFPGLLLFLASLLLLYPSLPDPLEGKKTKPLSLKLEFFFLGLVLAIAFFFRCYRIDSLPAGMHTDQGLTGLCALRILHEGWRPFAEVFDYQVPELVLFYQLAAWFGVVGSSYFTFHLFFILLSLAAFPLVYWTLRQWVGPRVALFSLFMLAVMRWNWIETRNGYPSIQVPFYLFGALAFWTYWVKNRKTWALMVSALFVGVGFYTYQAFKIVPVLMGIYALYEFFRQQKKTRSVRPYLSYFLVVLVLILPLLTVMFQKGVLGHRESDLFIGTKVAQEYSLKPLWDVWTGNLLMFNRQGDPNPRHNIPGHRMLDDVTAVLFILGLALAWKRRKEPAGFYPLVGFSALLLTGLLSTDVAHSNRLVSLTPFVAYFAGGAFTFFWEKAEGTLKRFVVPTTIGILLLVVMTAQNAYTYLVSQAANPSCREAFGLEQTFIGRDIESESKCLKDQILYFIPSLYFQNNTVNFLAYPIRSNIYKFNLNDWAAAKTPSDQTSSVVYLDDQRPGVLEFMKTLYSPTWFSPYLGEKSSGITKVFLPIDSEYLTKAKPWLRGLKGIYINSSVWNAKPITVQMDPVLNFTSKFDFPFTNYPPFRIRWTGTLEVPQPGDYQFQVLTTDNAQMWLDRKQVSWEKPWRLAAGARALRLDFEKDSGDTLALTFLWKKPGAEKWEVVPATAFGKITSKMGRVP